MHVELRALPRARRKDYIAGTPSLPPVLHLLSSYASASPSFCPGHDTLQSRLSSCSIVNFLLLLCCVWQSIQDTATVEVDTEATAVWFAHCGRTLDAITNAWCSAWQG